MGRPHERKRPITATDELPLARAAPQPRLARGTVRQPKLERSGDLNLYRRFTELRSLVIESVEQLTADDKVRVFVFAPDPVFAWVDTMLVEHVIADLLTSAIEGSAPRSSVVIRVEEHRAVVCVSITDHHIPKWGAA